MADKSDNTSSIPLKCVTIDEEDEEDEEPEVYDVQHASDIYGEWGPLQRNVTIYYIALYVIASFQNQGIIFYMPPIDYHCKLPPGGETKNVSKCFEYEGSSEPCREWTYDRSFYKSTLIDEFDLVCDREHFISLTKSIYHIGYMIASILTGWMSDKYGRLFTFKICIIVELIGSLSQAWSPNIYCFMVARIFLGIGAYGRFTTGMLLCEYILTTIGFSHSISYTIVLIPIG